MMVAMSHERRISLLSPAVGTANIGDHLIELAIRRLLGDHLSYQRFSIRQELTTDEIDRINQTCCAILCGTNLYQHEWESELTESALQKIRVPVIPFGLGGSASTLSDTQVGERTSRMMRLLHEKCELGGARDPHAMQVLSRIGVKNAILTGCPVLFWTGTGSLPKVAPLPRRRFVLTARNWLMHRWPDNVDNPVQIEVLGRILRHLEKQEEVVLAVHEPFDRSLLPMFGLPPASVVDTADPADYIRLYTDPSSCVLAMRLHAGMLAVANGVPAVFIGHDSRTYSFCQMMGLECIELFGDQCADRCIDRLDRIAAGDVASFALLPDRFEPLRRAMREFLVANRLLEGDRDLSAAHTAGS
jgi:hypothetical protein